MQVASDKFAPPWRDVRPDGRLGPDHGPKTMGAFARQNARVKDWSYQPTKDRGPDDLVHEYMLAESETASGREREVYADVFCNSYTHAESAEFRGLSKSSTKSYIRRLREKAKAWDAKPKVILEGQTLK